MKKLKIRLKVCWYIISGKYTHWFIINLDRKNLINLLKNEDVDCDGFFHGIQPHIFNRIIKIISHSKNDAQMLLDKIKFETEAEFRWRNKNK